LALLVAQAELQSAARQPHAGDDQLVQHQPLEDTDPAAANSAAAGPAAVQWYKAYSSSRGSS